MYISRVLTKHSLEHSVASKRHTLVHSNVHGPCPHIFKSLGHFDLDKLNFERNE